MKLNSIGNILLMLFLILFSCSKEKGGWVYVDSESDSIISILDKCCVEGAPGLRNDLIERLIKKSEADPQNRMLKVQSLYWKMFLMPDSTEQIKKEIWTLVDSSQYPYLKARVDLKDDAPVDMSNFLQRHKKLKDIEDYFNTVGDVGMQLMASRYLETFYARIGDMHKYKEYAWKIRDLCRKIGNDTIIVKSNLNIALAEIHVGDSLKAREILFALLKNPVLKNDSDIISRVYVNLGEVTSEPAYFQKAIDTNRVFRENEGYYNTLRFAMMKKYEERGEYERSDSMFELLMPLVETEGDYSAKLFAHRIMLRHVKAKRDYNNVLEETKIIQDLGDSIFSAAQFEELTSNNYKRQLEIQEEQFAKNRKKSNMVIALILLGIFIIVTILLIISRRKRLNIKKEHEKDLERVSTMSRELDKEKATTLAMSLSLSERDKLIKNFSDYTESLTSGAQDAAQEYENLRKQIREATLTINEWDNFQTVFSKIHPLFLKHLKLSYPDITEGDSRLALYIAAGLSSKEIARLLQIQPDSIKKNRQRLRQRMHISSNDELEMILRNLL